MATQTALPPWLAWLNNNSLASQPWLQTSPFPSPAGSQASYLPQNNNATAAMGFAQGGYGTMPAGVTAPPDAMFSSNPLTAIPAAIKYGVTAPIQSISAAINSPTPTGTIRSQGARTGGARVVGGQQQTATASGLQTVVPNAGASTATTASQTATRTFGGVDAGAPRGEVSGTAHSPSALVLGGMKTQIGADGKLYMTDAEGGAYAPVVAIDPTTKESFQPISTYTADAARTEVLTYNTDYGTQRTTEEYMTSRGYVLMGGQWVYQGQVGPGQGGGPAASKSNRDWQNISYGGGARHPGSGFATEAGYQTWLRRQQLDAKEDDQTTMKNTMAGASFTVGTG